MGGIGLDLDDARQGEHPFCFQPQNGLPIGDQPHGLIDEQKGQFPVCLSLPCMAQQIP